MEARSDCAGEAKIRGGIRRWNRENGCAPVGGEEGNVAEGEQAAKRYHHREGIHALPIEDYMVYVHTFSAAAEPDLFSRPNVRKSPRKKSILLMIEIWPEEWKDALTLVDEHSDVLSDFAL
jgi:hypothetical protein